MLPPLEPDVCISLKYYSFLIALLNLIFHLHNYESISFCIFNCQFCSWLLLKYLVFTFYLYYLILICFIWSKIFLYVIPEKLTLYFKEFYCFSFTIVLLHTQNRIKKIQKALFSSLKTKLVTLFAGISGQV